MHLRLTSLRSALLAALVLGPAAAPDVVNAASPAGSAPTVSATDDLAAAIGGSSRFDYPDLFAGLSVDAKRSRIDVYAVDPVLMRNVVEIAAAKVPMATMQAVTVRILPARFSKQQMHAARARLWTVAEPWKHAGISIYSISAPHDGSGLVVTTNDPDSVSTLLAAADIGPLRAADVQVLRGEPQVPTTRNDDYPPYAGGVRIDVTGGNQTSGFSMRIGSRNYLVTAAHGGGPGSSVYDGSNDKIGNVSQVHTYRDASITPANTWSGVFTINESYTHYRSWGYSYYGQYVCQSGITSNQICGLKVVDEDYEYVTWFGWDFGDPEKPVRGVRVRKCAGCIANRGGDSGGPVYVYRSDGYLQSRGIVSTGSVVRGNGYEYMNFTETGYILSHFGGNLLTR